MKDNRLTNILLLVLLVLNLVFVGTWWFGHMKGHRKTHQNHESALAHESKGTMFMFNQLNFDSAQQVKLEALRKEHFKKMEVMGSVISRNEKGVMAALMVDPADSVSANKCADSIGYEKELMNKEFFRYFRSVKEICIAEQKSKFDSLITKMSKEFPHHHDMHHSDNGMKQDSAQAN